MTGECPETIMQKLYIKHEVPGHMPPDTPVYTIGRIPEIKLARDIHPSLATPALVSIPQYWWVQSKSHRHYR